MKSAVDRHLSVKKIGPTCATSPYVAKGVARLQEGDAKFQNGFGAMVRSRVTCVYDLAKKQVINVTIDAR